MIVRLAAELLSAECAVLETLDEQKPLFSLKELSDANENVPSEFHPCNELMRQSGQEMLIVPRLNLKQGNDAKGWIQRFEGRSFIGSVIFIDQLPIGTLALFIDPQRVITDNLLQLIRLLSVAIAVEERRRRALFALKESEEKYRVMFEGSPNGIVVVDIESLELKYVNPSISRMFGYTMDEMLTMTVEQLHPPPISKEVIYAIQRNEAQANLLTTDLACCRKDGSVFFSDIYSNNISFGGRKLVAGFFSDVTQRRNDQEALLNSNTALKKINAELDNFVYSVSHDLRAPLLAIQGLIRLIADSKDVLSGENSNYLNMVISSVNRMDDTIKEILEYSRNARLDIHVKPIDFQQMINEIFLDVKHIFPGSMSLDIKIKGKEDFFSDPYRMNTLLKNLIGNAVKYQRPESNQPYLKIGIQKDGEKAILRFEDNGEGIPPEHIDRIFDMFYRASNTTVGTGLGLYICREIVTNLGGTIDVKSTPGKGSVFTVQLKNLNS
jgi:PAS domain S-box-containing protein